MDRRIDGGTLNRRRTHGGHPTRPPVPLPSRTQVEAAAEMLRALGDPERVRLLLRLAESEAPHRGGRGSWTLKGYHPMTTCSAPTHADHAHQHGPGCGHSAVRHSGHVDYLHDGHLHHPHGDHCDDHGPLASA